jgi:hypothetical protein
MAMAKVGSRISMASLGGYKKAVQGVFQPAGQVSNTPWCDNLRAPRPSIICLPACCVRIEWRKRYLWIRADTKIPSMLESRKRAVVNSLLFLHLHLSL